MSFEPVELAHPVSGKHYTARTPVDLNDRVNEGYKRVEDERVVAPSPAPRVDYSTDYSYDTVEYRDAE